MLDELESGLRRIVADEIGDHLTRASDDGRRVPDEMDQRQMARAILRRELDNRSKTALRLGEPQLSADDEDALLERVLATAFSAAPGLDRLQRQDVTDVFVNGCNDVRLVTIDGDTEVADPIARVARFGSGG